MRRRVDKTTAAVSVLVVALISAYAGAVVLADRLHVTSVPSSVFSGSDDGLKVYFDYLEGLGYEPRVMTSFDDLPEGTIVLAAAQPLVSEPTPEESELVARWLREGGRLVLAGPHVRELLQRVEVGGAGSRRGDEAAALRPLLPSVYADGVSEVRLGGGRLLVQGPAWVSHLKDLDGQGMVSAPVGSGEIVWLADAHPMTNAGIGDADNARLVTLLATLGGGGIHFDEYHHGHVRGGGLLDRLGPGGRAASLLLAAALIVAMIGWGRRIGPPIPRLEQPEARGTSHIASLAELYRKAGARAAALEELEEGLRRALAVRHGTLAAGLARHREARAALERASGLRQAGVSRQSFLAAAGEIRRARLEVEGKHG